MWRQYAQTFVWTEWADYCSTPGFDQELCLHYQMLHNFLRSLWDPDVYSMTSCPPSAITDAEFAEAWSSCSGDVLEMCDFILFTHSDVRKKIMLPFDTYKVLYNPYQAFKYGWYPSSTQWPGRAGYEWQLQLQSMTDSAVDIYLGRLQRAVQNELSFYSCLVKELNSFQWEPEQFKGLCTQISTWNQSSAIPQQHRRDYVVSLLKDIYTSSPSEN